MQVFLCGAKLLMPSATTHRWLDSVAQNCMIGVMNAPTGHQQSVQPLQMQQFLCEAAHQIQLPLQAAALELELMLSGMRQQSPQALEQIRQRLRTVQQFVPRLLKYIKWEKNSAQIAQDRVPLHELISDAHMVCQHVLGDTSLQLKNLPDVCLAGDRRELLECLVVLIENAAKHCAVGGSITLSAELSDRTIALTVHNDCHGIAPEQLERIFEPFYQAAPTTQGRQGHGIGLSLARKIAHMHGGTLTASSDGRSFAAFTLVLPQMVESTPRRSAAGLKSNPAPSTASRPLAA